MGSRRLLLVVLLAATSALTGDEAWPLFQANARRTGLSTAVGPQAFGVRWEVEGSFGAYDAAPVVVGKDGLVYAVAELWSPSSSLALVTYGAGGNPRWKCALPDDSAAAPAVAPDGTVVVGLVDGTVFAVAADGTPAWTYRTGGSVTSSAAFGADGTIYIGSRDECLHAIAPGGKARWTFATGGWVCAAPALGADGTIYATSWDGNAYAIAPDGVERWRFRTRRAISASPVVSADGTVYVASEDGTLYALRANGDLAWSVATGGWIYFSPCLDPAGNIRVASNDGQLRSLSPTGKLLWQASIGQPESNAVCDARGTVYVAAARRVRAVDHAGNSLWQHECDSTSHLALGPDGTLYVIGTQQLRAIR